MTGFVFRLLLIGCLWSGTLLADEADYCSGNQPFGAAYVNSTDTASQICRDVRREVLPDAAVGPEVLIVQFHEDPAASLLPPDSATEARYQGVAERIAQLGQLQQSYLSQIESTVPGTADHVIFRYRIVMNGLAIRGGHAEMAALRALPFVKKAYAAREVEALLDYSVPHIGAPEYWQQIPSIDGGGINVAVIDTGIDWAHPDIGPCQEIGPDCRVSDGVDFVDLLGGTGDGIPADEHGHGTHVAAIAGSHHPQLRGVAPGIRFIAYRVLDESGRGSEAALLAALERAADPNEDGDLSDHAHIANLSLGIRWVNDPDDDLALAADNLSAVGTLVVAGAGNDGDHGYMSIGSPGCARSVLTVGASTDNDFVTHYSSRGPLKGGLVKPDVLAPGGGSAVLLIPPDLTGLKICAARLPGRYPDNGPCGGDMQHVELLGTSMAAPHVAGLAALLKDNNPNLLPIELKYTIREMAREIGNGQPVSAADGPCTQGHGLIQALPISPEVPFIAQLERLSDTDALLSLRARAGRISAPTPAGLQYRVEIARFLDSPLPVRGPLDEQAEGLLEWSTFHTGTIEPSPGGLRDIELPVLAKNLLDEGAYLVRLRIYSSLNVISTDYHSFSVQTIKVLSPYRCDSQGQEFEFRGSVLLPPETRYEISYRPISGVNYVTTGIRLVNDGDTTISSGVLGTFSAPSDFTSGFYKFRLRILGENGIILRTSYFSVMNIDTGMSWPAPAFIPRSKMQLDADSEPGIWPLQISVPQISSRPGVSGKTISFPGIGPGGIPAVKRVNHLGQQLPDLPISEPFRMPDWYSLQEGDFNADGSNDYTLNMTVLHPADQTRQLYEAHDSQDGSMLYQQAGPDAGSNEHLSYTNQQFSARADLNRDGSEETIILQRNFVEVSEDGENLFGWSLDVVDAQLNSLRGWPKRWLTEGLLSLHFADSNLLVANFDQDPELEVAMAGDSPIEGGEQSGTTVWIFNHDGTSLNAHWPQVVFDVINRPSQSVAADFDNDGVDELVVLASFGLTVYDTQTGRAKPGWPVILSTISWPRTDFPAIGDVDGDGALEIVISHGQNIWVFNPDGTTDRSIWPVFNQGQDEFGVVLADVNSDGALDIIHEGAIELVHGFSCIFSEVHARDGRTGSELPGFPKHTEYSFGLPRTVVDIDGDGELELAVLSNAYYRNLRPDIGTNPDTESLAQDILHSWPLHIPDSAFNRAWNSPRGGAARLGRYMGLAAPVKLQAVAANWQERPTSVTLRWSPPGNGNSGDGYAIQWAEPDTFFNPVDTQFVGHDVYSFNLRGLPAGQYRFRVGSFSGSPARMAWTSPVKIKLSQVPGLHGEENLRSVENKLSWSDF